MSKLPPDSLAFSLYHASLLLSRVMAGQSLADGMLHRIPAPQRPAVQECLYCCLRQYGRGDFFLGRLLHKPLPLLEIRALLLLALSRLEGGADRGHTIVDQTVEAAGQFAGGKFKGLANAVLRTFVRQMEFLQSSAMVDEVACHQYPGWWLNCLKSAYPAQWQAIAHAGNLRPPMALRVNRRQRDRDKWLMDFSCGQPGARAWGDSGVLLEYPLPVQQLQGFDQGHVSVQDLGAQRAAELLAPPAGSRVLDACAAPGGKTAHLLESFENLDLLALDKHPERCRKVGDNLSRLGLTAEIRVADCTHLQDWWDGRLFDAILADVPCSASGVVRRHPDSKWLRRESDIASFSEQQSTILATLWQALRAGGKLLYATCSVFPEENSLQIARFLGNTPDARIRWEEQLLPVPERDGFYYGLLEKMP